MIKSIKKHITPYIFTLKIPSVSRISLDTILKRLFKKLKPGIVMDVGSKHSPYKKYIPFTKYLRLDIDEKSEPDINCDLHKIDWETEYFDTVIATEVLEHLYNPQKAINEIHKILKPGGVCILSTRFIYAYHPDPQDYYRFTTDSLNYLFRDFSEVKVIHHGNRFQTIWQLINTGKINVILNVLNPIFAKVNFKETRFPLGFVIWAKK